MSRNDGPVNHLRVAPLDKAGLRNPPQLVNIFGISSIGSGGGAIGLSLIKVFTESKEDITQAGMDTYFENAFGLPPVNGEIVVLLSANFSQPDTRDLSLWEYQNGWSYIEFAAQEAIVTP